MFQRKKLRLAEAQEVALLARGFAAAYGPDAGLAAEGRFHSGHGAERRILQAVVRRLTPASATA